MLDKERHLLVLKQLLREVYSDNELSAQLVFKGGTALVLFYGLQRFSTDLDFDLRNTVEQIDLSRLSLLAERYLTIRDSASKTNTYLLEGSYESGMQQIKIEVNRRVYPQSFTLHNYLGMSIPILAREYLLAHKLCAITSRRSVQNRDIYDADFMLKQNWQANPEIIQLRVGLAPTEYYAQLLRLCDSAEVAGGVMVGLGEVLEPEQRAWANANLIKSFREQLLLRL